MMKHIKILFTLSVLLNVLLLGIGGGMAFKHSRHRPWDDAKKELSSQSQAIMTENFKSMRQSMRPLFEESRRTKEELKLVLSQDEFDSAEFDRLTARLRDLRQQMGEKFAASAKEMALKLPAEDRKKMAERFVRGFDWKRRGHGSRACEPKISQEKSVNNK